MTRPSARNTFVLVIGIILAPALEVRAKVTLPGGKTIPDPALSCYSGKPGGLAAVFACACTAPGVCNIGKPCPGGSTSCDPGTNGTCESTLWHSINDNTCIPSNKKGLDPIQDATVKPETFRPVCGLTFSLLTRGNAMFNNGFGWYNVTSNKPDPKDLHILVGCGTAAGASKPFNMLADPAYKGGDIGFFLVTPESHTQKGTCAKGDCCATVARAKAGEGYIYYSESKHNPDNSGPGSYIHLLMYNSRIDGHKFYFAWEDTYAGSSTDYSDFVTSVSGISCAGAGKQCATASQGICGLGVTKCGSDGALSCVGSFSAAAEKCDGLDNDCDGKVDNGATCPVGKVCYHGTCVSRCTTSLEFPCQAAFECDKVSGLCLDKLCKGKVCDPGEICRFGKCDNGCGGVVCPKGQICQGGICLDPCAVTSCKTAEVCTFGVCIPDCTTCGGLTCLKGKVCDKTTGLCIDPTCAQSCKAGTYCDKGKCVDLCHGVTCPGNVQCKDGTCPPPGIGKPPATADMGAVLDDSGAPISADSGGGGDAGSTGNPFYVDDGGCTCQAGTGGAAGAAGLLALGLGLLFLRGRGRRRRST